MFKINQTVWCAIYGAGVVTEIRHESGTYPVVVAFKNACLAVYTTDGKYHKAGNVTLFPYPVEITKAVTKPSIDWSHVSENFKYLAMDDEGLHHLYVEKPELWGEVWTTYDLYIPAEVFTSFVPGTCDWRDSLVKRPN